MLMKVRRRYSCLSCNNIKSKRENKLNNCVIYRREVKGTITGDNLLALHSGTSKHRQNRISTRLNMNVIL
uniref:Uncharacterized protein n=1 Tax=Arundo donax TaxID=35708 RepID=A0A0A9SW06_ARUDO